MSTLFFRNKRLFALAVLMILSAGLSSLMTIGRQEDPTITNLFATIVTPYSGAGPARVEALVTEKIEDELRQIEEIDEVQTSSSRSGISVVQIELSQFISDTLKSIRHGRKSAMPCPTRRRNFRPACSRTEFRRRPHGRLHRHQRGNRLPRPSAPPATLSSAAMANCCRTGCGRYREPRYRPPLRRTGAKKFSSRSIARKLASLGLTVRRRFQTAITRADSKVSAGQVRGRTSANS